LRTTLTAKIKTNFTQARYLTMDFKRPWTVDDIASLIAWTALCLSIGR
jgi:hypothetical protein